MLIRRLLLAVGFLALAAGIVLTALSLRTPRQTVVEAPVVPKQTVLVAAKALPAATLLRSDDIKWVEVSGEQVPPGAFVRNAAVGEPEVLGAATAHALKAGEAIAADAIIKPTEAGFLPAVLTPGMRALSIQIDAAAVGAGLIQPGDRVDVLLTQSLRESGTGAAFRSVSETILRDLRVIAVDQTHMLGVEQDRKATVTAAPRVPQIVTLEVTIQQAEKLLVAHQLGRLQLTLRGLSESTANAASVPPTFATDVSQALRYLSEGPGPVIVSDSGRPIEVAPGIAGGGGSQTFAPAPVAVDIFRGTRTEHRCYSEKSATTVECKPGTAAPAANPDTGAAPAPGAAPGKASALVLPQHPFPS